MQIKRRDVFKKKEQSNIDEKWQNKKTVYGFIKILIKKLEKGHFTFTSIFPRLALLE